MPRLFLVRRDHHRAFHRAGKRGFASRDFLWRLSSATVELEESTFTPLPDFDRIILTLEGEMDICHDGGPWIHLEEFSPHRFDGASETRSRGKVTDFNLMLRKGACTGNLEVLSGSGSEQTEDVYRTLFYCHEGPDGGPGFRAGVGDPG